MSKCHNGLTFHLKLIFTDKVSINHVKVSKNYKKVSIDVRLNVNFLSAISVELTANFDTKHFPI